MSIDLITRVKSIQTPSEDTAIVDVEVDDGGFLNRRVKKIRARGRAMIAVGAIDVAASRGVDIANAISNLSFGEISRATEIVSSAGNVISVKVNR